MRLHLRMKKCYNKVAYIIFERRVFIMGVGFRIREVAKERKINFKELAKKAGVSYNTLYSIIKRDSDRVDTGTLSKVAQALDVPLEKLATGDETFGERLKRIRTQDKITLQKLSEKVEIPEEALQMYEDDIVEPGLSTTNIIADALEITSEELTGKPWRFPTTGDQIISNRQLLGKTQEELAKETELPLETIQKFELDISQPTYREIQKLALALETTMDVLMDPTGLSRLPKQRSEDEQLQKNKRDMLGYFSDLTPAGQLEAIKSIKLLLRIPEYNIHTAGDED